MWSSVRIHRIHVAKQNLTICIVQTWWQPVELLDQQACIFSKTQGSETGNLLGEDEKTNGQISWGPSPGFHPCKYAQGQVLQPWLCIPTGADDSEMLRSPPSAGRLWHMNIWNNHLGGLLVLLQMHLWTPEFVEASSPSPNNHCKVPQPPAFEHGTVVKKHWRSDIQGWRNCGPHMNSKISESFQK